MTITYEPPYDRNNGKKNTKLAKNTAKNILKENAQSAFNYYLKNEPFIAYCIAREHNLIEEKIKYAESVGETYHAAIIAQENGMLKTALKYFKKCDCPERVQEIRESLIPIEFSKNIGQKTREIDLLPRVLKKPYTTNKEIVDEILFETHNKN